jgi:hypothetical protein
MDTPELVVWIVTLLGLAYLFLRFTRSSFSSISKGNSAKGLVALSVLFAEKKEILLSLYALFKSQTALG